jgi:ribose/xylose/arabinose/galactoside ABC-type transport system permease subunit
MNHSIRTNEISVFQPVLQRASRKLGICAASVTALLLCGCILGSFFPVWLLCGIASILLSFAVHLLVRRLGWEEQLAPPLLVYPAMAAAICLLLWLVFFS